MFQRTQQSDRHGPHIFSIFSYHQLEHNCLGGGIYNQGALATLSIQQQVDTPLVIGRVSTVRNPTVSDCHF